MFDENSHSSSGPRCNTCNTSGHQAKHCPDQICTKCQGRGHNGRDCPEHKRIRVSEGQNDTVYVQGLAPTITEEDIIAHFSKVGMIRVKKGKGPEREKLIPQVHVYRNKTTNTINGDCTVTYEDPEAAPAAVRRLHNTELKGSVISVSLAEKNANSGANQVTGMGMGSSANSRNNPFSGGNNGGGDNWTCPSCNNSNFPSRNMCYRCKAPRDGGNGGGGGGGYGGYGGGYGGSSGGKFQSRGGGSGGYNQGGDRGGYGQQSGYRH